MSNKRLNSYSSAIRSVSGDTSPSFEGSVESAARVVEEHIGLQMALASRPMIMGEDSDGLTSFLIFPTTGQVSICLEKADA